MSQKSILIIGAGVGGLSTGCYAQMNGYRTLILEMHARPGGVCTSWSRKGYVFDGCIHNLAGTSADSRVQELWRDLGVIPNLEMQAYDELVSVERGDGPPLILHTDLERLDAHLKQLSPADAPLIDELIAAARGFRGFDLLGL
ncbi:MAG TPA: NAD(P)-binding protein, partial [Phenylobacterium sp.]